MENHTPLLLEDLDIRISKISNGEEEIKEEDKNISSCDGESNRNLQKSLKEHSADPKPATETKTQFDHLNSQSKFLADNNAMDEDARSLKSVIKSNADHQDLQTEKRKQKKKVGHMKNDWKVSKVCIKTQIGKFQCKECEKTIFTLRSRKKPLQYKTQRQSLQLHPLSLYVKKILWFKIPF